jgi:hypothetical protein
MDRTLRVHSRRAVAWQRHDHPDHHAVHGENLAVRTHLHLSVLHPNLKCVSLSFSPRQHAYCTPRTLTSTLVYFERATTEVENTHWTPSLMGAPPPPPPPPPRAPVTSPLWWFKNPYTQPQSRILQSVGTELSSSAAAEVALRVGQTACPQARFRSHDRVHLTSRCTGGRQCRWPWSPPQWAASRQSSPRIFRWRASASRRAMATCRRCTRRRTCHESIQRERTWREGLVSSPKKWQQPLHAD